MSSSIHQAYEQELRDIHASLARLTERLANVRPSAYEENIGTMKFQIEGLTREVDQLKSANAQLTSSVKWLQHQNAELERRLSHRKPEIENVVASRARFQKRLANAYKVIKDLLGEGDLESSSSSSSGRHREEFSDTPETITTSSNNNATSCPAPLEGSRTPQPRHHQLSEERAVNEPYTTRIAVPDKNEESSGSDPTDHGVFIAGSSSASASTSSQSDDPNVVNIHYNKPPGSSRGLCSGPLQWSHIAPPLGIESDEIQAIQSLDSRTDFGVRLRIVPSYRDIAAAFIYDPLFLEELGTSYLIDWAFQRDNRKAKQSILQMRGLNPSFYTFTYPVKLGNWYYVGALAWRVANKPLYWPTLNTKDRRRIAKKLSARCGDTYSGEEIERMLDSGELEEMCLELEKVGDTEVSLKFRHEMEHQDQQVQTRENSSSNGSDVV